MERFTFYSPTQYDSGETGTDTIYSDRLYQWDSSKYNQLETIKIIRQDSKGYNDFNDFDIRLCYWGNGSAGKILKDNESYSAEYKIKIHSDFKEDVIELLNNINWFDELNCIAMLKIQQFHIINVLRKYIPNIY